MRISLVSDTHGLLRPELLSFLDGSDHIVHAGVICDAGVLQALRAIAPVTAVRGNNDRGEWASALPETQLFRLDGVFVFAIHDLADLAVDPIAAGIRVVISGHSHQPRIERRDGVLYVNPGSAGPRRFKLPISAGELTLSGGAPSARIVEFGGAQQRKPSKGHPVSHHRPQAVPLPRHSRVVAVYEHPDLADAYAIDLPPGTARDPELLARFIFAQQPAWVSALMAVRDAGVSLFGLKTGRSLRSPGEQRGRVGIFRLYESGPVEVLLGEDDKHLDFRASLLYRAEQSPAAPASVVLSTVVQCHNLLGRTYLRLISPFHRQVVQSFLRQAARAGWPRDDAAATPAESAAGA